MTSGIPRATSMTWFLTQSAAFSLETSASAALSNMLMVIITSGPLSSRYAHPLGTSFSSAPAAQSRYYAASATTHSFEVAAFGI